MNGTWRAWLAVTFLLTFGTGCGGPTVPDGIEPVRDFDVERYSGRWYEIARLDHRFERGLERITAHYTLLPDGTVEVVNRGYDARKSSWREARGKARFVGSPDVGALEVSFFGPFYGGYNVVEIDAAYEHVLISGPDRSYLWILARSPEPDAATVDRLIARAATLGFDTAALIRVRH